MKKLFAGAAVAAMAVFGLTGCEERDAREPSDLGAELKEEQRELEEAKNQSYDSAAERNAAIEEEKQDVREEARDLQDERDNAYGGAHEEGIEVHEDELPVDASDVNTQELEPEDRY